MRNIIVENDKYKGDRMQKTEWKLNTTNSKIGESYDESEDI
jgi:hypothetical protein